jgi:hypothetical protein
LRLSYSGDLRTRNNRGSETLVFTLPSIWMGDSYKRWRVWHGPTELFKQWGDQTVMAVVVIGPDLSREERAPSPEDHCRK